MRGRSVRGSSDRTRPPSRGARTSRRNIAGTKPNDTTLESSTPPAIAVANGGQNAPPPRISGRKPPKVVIVVEQMWRDEPATTSTIASVSPAAARGSAFNPDSRISAALIDTPIEPMTPISALMPNGWRSTASDEERQPRAQPRHQQRHDGEPERAEAQHDARDRQRHDDPERGKQVVRPCRRANPSRRRRRAGSPAAARARRLREAPPRHRPAPRRAAARTGMKPCTVFTRSPFLRAYRAVGRGQAHRRDRPTAGSRRCPEPPGRPRASAPAGSSGQSAMRARSARPASPARTRTRERLVAVDDAAADRALERRVELARHVDEAEAREPRGGLVDVEHELRRAGLERGARRRDRVDAGQHGAR